MSSRRSPLMIGQKPLSLEDVYEVAANGRKVGLSTRALTRLKRAHAFLQKKVSEKGTVYGVNTGFGPLSDVRIPDRDIEKLQYNFIRSHALGIGPALEDRYVRAMLLLRANALALGHSGVSIAVVRLLVEFLNRGVIPQIPEQGSVGASGDLAPLAHMSLVLIGEGKARYRGRIYSGAAALRAARLKPVRLGAKEGLALTNGTQFMAAYAVFNLLEAEKLSDIADAAAAMSLEAVRGTAAAFDPLIHELRPHPGQLRVAERVRRYLGGRTSSAIARSHKDCGKVQDPYSFRCVPQVHGATRDLLTFVREALAREVNSVTDNPLIFPAQRKILSGGNFHGQILAVAMDALSIGVAELASISEQRIDKLVNPIFSGLPAFLVRGSGLNSGFMIAQYTAASIVSENKTLCHPASVDSIPTSLHKEDHVSMGAWAARKAARVVENTRRVLAIELMAAAQGIDLLRPLKTTLALEALHRRIRTGIRPLAGDRSLHEDLVWLEAEIRDRGLPIG